MRFLLLMLFSITAFADDHASSTDFSNCEGKFVNYYVAKLTPTGSVEGMVEATKMHQKFYDDRGAKVKVYPALQYMRNEDGGTKEDLHRTSTMVSWESIQAWNTWRDDFNALSDAEREAQQIDYDAFVAKYNENTEVVGQRRWCML